MRYKNLAWLPIVVALPLLLVELAMGPSPTRAVTLRFEVESAKLLWLVAAALAARAFEPGDYLRRAWLLLGAASAAFLLRDVTLLPVFDADAGTGLRVLRGVLVFLGNAAQVGGVWTLARVWNAAGLDDDDAQSKAYGRALLAGSVALSLALTGPSLAHDAVSLMSGNLDALPHVASDLGDAISFVLIGPLARSALALRGGVIFWSWSFFAASQVVWMLFDGARSVSELYGSPPGAAPMIECLRVIGVLYICAAAVAQRWVVAGRGPYATEAGSRARAS